MALNPKIENDLRKAIKHFWSTRKTQARKQGSKTGSRDAGARTAVTGGRQMDGFVSLVRSHLCGSGLPEAHVYCEKRVELPGWYRPEKKWDLLIVADGQFLAGIEFKSQVGSFGNNYNNRTEEAIGSACDIWAAYREGAFKPSARPWLGYMMLLEEAPESTRPVRAQEPHFKVFPEFKDASYAERYEILLTKLVRERFYDSACFLLSDAKTGRKGNYKEPADELNFEKFMASLLARAISVARTKK
jgi:restriction endonuclease XhoI-like protein